MGWRMAENHDQCVLEFMEMKKSINFSEGKIAVSYEDIAHLQQHVEETAAAWSASMDLELSPQRA